MSLGTILYNIVVMPLQILFETLFSIINSRITNNYGLTIIALSLVINILVFPLYKRADAIQKEERDTEAKLKKGVDHIKKTFKGNEQMMMLQEYYRQNNYKPTYVIKGLLPLLLQIPFFMAAYNFLSNYSALQGVSFGPIKDLGSPDQLLTVFGITINVLPILMTLINFISSYIYTKGFPLKNKVQLYGIAIIFLVLLYNRPAGLTFYWTLNNLFSLVKNIFYRLKNPKKVVSTILSILGASLSIIGIVYKNGATKIIFCGIGFILLIPIIYILLSKKINLKLKEKDNNPKLFIFSSLFMTVLTGLVIPSSVISSSPQEFIIVGYMENPTWYVISAFCIALGTFILWLGIFYWLSNKKYKYVFDYVIFTICLMSIVNYMVFGKKFGLLNSSLQYSESMFFSMNNKLINLGSLFLIIIISIILYKLIEKFLKDVMIIALISIIIISGINIYKINKSISTLNINTISNNNKNINVPLSKNGKNVMVIMLDSAMGEYIPYIFNELPELKDKFSGFTYFSNVISYGNNTNFGVPPLFGGYEYTPIEMNKRNNETLVSKHNEALKVLPVIFDSNGYKTTVSDPPYANYQEVSDLSIYDEYPSINKFRTTGVFSIGIPNEDIVKNNFRNFFCFSITKVSPTLLQVALYHSGQYNGNNKNIQIIKNIHESIGDNKGFLNGYNVLENLSKITTIDTNDKNTFFMFQNITPHENALLQKPKYSPSANVDNTTIDKDCYDKYIVNGTKLHMDDTYQVSNYHSNIASLIKLGEYFDYLKQNSVYDNTRIVIAADHGHNTKQIDSFIFDKTDSLYGNLEFYFPLLMFKDFNAKEFIVSDEFMTQADVPTLATKGLIDNPVNPFTKKPINSDEKKNNNVYVFASSKWSIAENNGNQFLPVGKWYLVHDNIWDLKNWKVVGENTYFPNK